MNEPIDPIITVNIHRNQFETLTKMLLETLFETDTKHLIDLILRTIRIPFQKNNNQLALILLDQRRRGIVAAFLLKFQLGGHLQSIDTIPLELSAKGITLSEVFKIQSTEISNALENLKSLLEVTYGNLWTLIVADFNQISKLFFLLNFEPTKETVGRVAKTVIAQLKDGKIKLTPLPEVIAALEKII